MVYYNKTDAPAIKPFVAPKHKCQNPPIFDVESSDKTPYWECPMCGKVWTMTKTKFYFTKTCTYFWQEGKVITINKASF